MIEPLCLGLSPLKHRNFKGNFKETNAFDSLRPLVLLLMSQPNCHLTINHYIFFLVIATGV